MRRLCSALLALCAAGAVARAQETSVTGPCATPDSVVFRGNVRISDALLRGDAGINAGVRVSYRDLQLAIKNLYATGQFAEIAASCEAAGDQAVLVFTVRERPLLSDVSVAGVDRLSPGSVRDRVDLLVGRPVDPNQVTRSVARIDSLYESAGYYLARVTVDTTITDGQAKLVFNVDEGRRLAVSGIQITGNSQLSDKDVVGAMSTHPEGFLWWKKGEFDENVFASDIAEKIPQRYAGSGFIDMQITRDTLIVDRERGKALIEISLQEGPQYHIGDFEVTGSRRFSSEDIARFYPFGERGRTLTEAVKDILTPGDGPDKNVFDLGAWQAATQRVQEAYQNEGYIYASVNPIVERHAAGADSVPTVDLRWEVDERTPAIVNRVEIQGNDITVDNCIRDQILVVPGDVFNRDLLIRSYQSISNLGFFETPLPAPDTRQANEQGDVDVIFSVKEKHTGQVNFGASVGQGYGVGGFIGFDQPNLFGLCKRGSLQWQFGRYINDFNLSYTDPRIKQSRISGMVTAYHTRSQFTIQDIGRTTRTGGQIRFGFPLPGTRWTRLSLDYSGEQVSYGSEGLVGTIQCGQNGNSSTCFRSAVGVTLDRDTRIDMPFPSMGTHQSISASFNGGPLGGSAAYQRYTAEMRSYATLASIGGQNPGSQPIKIVFGLSTRAGALFGNAGPFFISQQFSLGGVQYGEPLRGYEEFSITPMGYIPNADAYRATRESFGSAFFTNTMELGVRFNQQLYLNAFYDAGNLWARPRDFNPTRLFRGAGVGASLVTPLGPLGIDLGYGFDRVDAFGRKDPKWQVHFKFGQVFY